MTTGEKMTKREELLDKQLELLAEKSKDALDIKELVQVSNAMCEIYSRLTCL